ncbi:MAG: M28 family peptidase [Planctomycetota bacterium]|nr:M28 family peptidase [Planctomycetota bacterium]
MTKLPSPHRIAPLLFLALVFNALSMSGSDTAKVADTPRQRLSDSVRFLSSDELEGRGPETAGLNKAADYIAGYFSRLGLKTDSYNGTPFQRFEISTDIKLGKPENNRLTLTGPTGEQDALESTDLTLGFEFNPLALGASGSFQGSIVFVGYGIQATDLKYDEYANLNVKDKVVVMLRKEPQQSDSESIFDGTKASRHATFQSKVSNAYQQGAAAVIMVNDAGEAKRYVAGLKHALSQYAAQLAAEQASFSKLQTPTSNQLIAHQQALAQVSRNISDTASELGGDGDSILEFNGAGSNSNRKSMPVFFARRASINPMIQAALGMSLTEIEQQIDRDLKPITGALDGWTAEGEASLLQTTTEVKNVVGVLEGTGPLKDETIVVGAHYDHLGYGGRGSLAPWTKDIHNGADDNSSGTSVLLETAHQLATRKNPTRRRIVFIAFSAEERGLIGSARYVKEPLYSLEETVAMINLDMVGRLTDNKLIATGTGTSDIWNPLLDELNKTDGFEITRKPEGVGPSDHQSFYLKNVPVLHLFTGLHEFYHRPSDDFETINFEGMDRIATLTKEIVAAVDQADTRPNFKKAEKKRNVENTGGDRPYFGSIPDYSENTDGLPLTGVSENGPAAKAGIKPKDIVVALGKYKIGGIEDFDSALRKFKGGDKVTVKVLRGGKEVTLTIILGQPR